MSTFGRMKARVLLYTQGHLQEAEIEQILNGVHQEELESRAWARRRTNTVLNTVAPYSTGTVSVASGSTAVVGVGTTFTAGMVGRQIRIANSDVLLTIAVVTDPTHISLETAWPGAAVTGGSFIIYQQFYSITGADQILNMTCQLPIEETTREILNRDDPARRSTGFPPQRWAPAGRDSNDYARFELWPIADSANVITVEYLIAHTDMHLATDRPLIPAGVIVEKALRDACRAVFALRGDQRWLNIALTYEQTYQDEYAKAVEQDKLQFGLPPQVQDVESNFVGADQIYNHDFGD